MNKLYLLLTLFIFASINMSAQTPSSTPKTPKPISGGVLNGKSTSLPVPEYPAAAQAVRATGSVNVQVLIDEQGTVISANAVSGHPLLRQTAEQAALKAKFSPTTLQGQPVKVSGIITYNFVDYKTDETLTVEKTPIKKGYEEATGMMGLGVFLTMMEISFEDDWEAVTKEEIKQSPQVVDELLPLTTITKEMAKEDRDKIFRGVISSISNKLKGSDAWQFEFGRELGGLFVEMYNIANNSDKQIDGAMMKIKLQKVRDLTLSAPTDFPIEVLSEFKKLTKFADEPNLNSKEKLQPLMEQIMIVVTTISPDLPK